MTATQNWITKIFEENKFIFTSEQQDSSLYAIILLHRHDIYIDMDHESESFLQRRRHETHTQKDEIKRGGRPMLRTFYETSSSKMNVPPIKQHETTKRKIHFLSLDTRGGGGREAIAGGSLILANLFSFPCSL